MAIVTLGPTVLDCPDPLALATFYATLLDGKVERDEGDNEWVEVHLADGPPLAFQLSEGYRPPSWPGTERGQQFHLDFSVPRDRWDEAERQVLELGATKLEGDGGTRNWRVYADPVGHPFCLCAH
ncbi:VOC family protein [Streptomyces triticirhizae]|uniref:VOC family protein n=1 Tax=Streptomyces triticirhizae TaxID=2483353 RepID=A0A3M2LR08_9ACTN|nr:VOC family protein [Streptomyces triticirhizae]RMI37298.1 VOC family protein [Streptomyces triticirhizae]